MFLKRDWLNGEQRRAVEHVLESTDCVILIRGRAGVGKTSMMSEAVEAIESGGNASLPGAFGGRLTRCASPRRF